MSNGPNEYWNSQGEPQDNNGYGAPRSGGLLSQYSPSGQASQPVQPLQVPPLPAGQPVPTTSPSPFSPMPPSPMGQYPQLQQPGMPQGGPGGPGWQAPGLFSHAVQSVRQWSGKFAAAHAASPVDQNPLVLYRPAAPPAHRPVVQVRRKPWKRSHALRVSMQMRRRRSRWQKSGFGAKKIITISVSVFAVLLVALISSGAGSAYAYYQSQYPQVQEVANNQIEQSTRIYDRNGNLIYTAYDGKYGRSTPISFFEVPGVMQDAMVAAEDHTFWDNIGIDPQGILRAATQNVSAGTVQSGGSTITQQVIKNLTHNAQDTLQRKVSEAALAIGLTQQYPKWKILEMYFNVSPFGAQELGVEAAVEDYFGLHPQCDANFKCIPAISFLDRDLTKCKNPKDLNTCQSNPLLALARASLLAGMPQNPPGYDPTIPQNKQAAFARQDYVLNEMMGLNMSINLGLGDQVNDASLGPITPAIIQQAEALTQKMNFVGFQAIKKDPHFVDWIIPQIENVLGNGDPQLGTQLFLTGGFNIRTTIDSNLETFIENDVRHHLRDPEYQIFLGDYGPLDTVHNVNDSAVVVEEAKTGEILAMDGSADYNNTSNPHVAGQVNVATSLRSPGSSFKPIVYATAFQMGWYPGIVLPDKETYFYTGSQTQDVNASINGVDSTYHPYDYGQTWHNLNSNIVLDIANSFNVPAVKTLEFAGIGNVLQMARRFGITDLDQDAVNYSNAYDAKFHTNKRFTAEQILGPSFALGAYDVSLLQMVGAYQVFADQGKRIPPQYVLDIWDNYGHHIYHYDPNNPPAVQVVSPQIAYLMTSILSNNDARSLEFAPDMVLTTSDWDNRPVAAKTGTSEGFQDNLTLGYTPDIVVGTWSGNADGALMVNTVGISGAAPIWHDALEYASGRDFSFDKGIVLGNWTTINDMSYNNGQPYPPDGFTQPAGVIQQEVNAVNGLMGGGYLSYMLDSDVPMQAGFTATMTTTTGTTTGVTPTATPSP